MNTGLQFIEQIRALRIKVADPVIEAQSETDRVENGGGGWLAQQFESTIASLGASFHKEHNTDDTHKTINASGPISERGRVTPLGVWVDVPLAAPNFSGAGAMTWTVPNTAALSLAYTLIGMTMILEFLILGSTVGGVVGYPLQITIPNNFRAVRYVDGVYFYSDNGGPVTAGLCEVAPNGTFVNLYKIPTGTNWTASAAATDARGSLTFEVKM